MTACVVLGHKYRFTAENEVLVWSCSRGCGAGGNKRYSSAADARRYAAAFDRPDSEDLGRNAPVLGMWPLRVWRAMTRSRRRRP
ncbi:hypothetical protein GCM10023199_50980 [Actinomycetospora chibensis]